MVDGCGRAYLTMNSVILRQVVLGSAKKQPEQTLRQANLDSYQTLKGEYTIIKALILLRAIIMFDICSLSRKTSRYVRQTHQYE